MRNGDVQGGKLWSLQTFLEVSKFCFSFEDVDVAVAALNLYQIVDCINC